MTLPTRHTVGAFPGYMWKSEVEIIDCLITEILKRDLRISVYDGEEYSVKRSKDRQMIEAAVAATDETQFILRDAEGEQVGWFLLIHGLWSDVIADHSDNELSDQIMASVNMVIDRLLEGASI